MVNSGHITATPWRLRQWLWMCVLGALGSFLWSPNTYAHAPMCDLSAATISAELPAPPALSGDISALPDCPEPVDSYAGWSPPADPPRLDGAQFDQPRAVECLIPLTVGSAQIIEVLRASEIGAIRAGFREQVYRPPWL